MSPVRKCCPLSRAPTGRKELCAMGWLLAVSRLGDTNLCFGELFGLRDLSLLKTVNYRESLGIFLCDRRTVGRHDHHSVCSRFRVLVPVSQPSVAGTRACSPATSADRLAAPTPSPPSSSFRRSAPVGVPYMSFAESSVLFRIEPQAPLTLAPKQLDAHG